MQLPLRHGICQFDDDDWPLIQTHFWWSIRQRDDRRKPRIYAVGRPRSDPGGTQSVMMHRLLLGLGSFKENPLYVDHENGDGLDNRRSNLRRCTHPENLANSASRPGTSHHKGVCWDGARGKWLAQIMINGKNRYLGRYATEKDAALAYNTAALAAWGEFARLNVIEDDA